MSVLVLNATYEPLAVISWKRAVTLVVGGRAELVAQDGERVVRSAGGREFPFPQVVRLVRMVSFAGLREPLPVRFSKSALEARDGRVCQVVGCAERGTTIDHVVPRSRGGATSWENCVLMCSPHNNTKASRLLADLGWSLKRTPKAPVATLVLRGLSPTAASTWTEWGVPEPALSPTPV